MLTPEYSASGRRLCPIRLPIGRGISVVLPVGPSIEGIDLLVDLREHTLDTVSLSGARMTIHDNIVHQDTISNEARKIVADVLNLLIPELNSFGNEVLSKRVRIFEYHGLNRSFQITRSLHMLCIVPVEI